MRLRRAWARPIALLALAPLAFAAPALAAERSPQERQTMAELAYVIGESHALRQACNGVGDMYWRNRMHALEAAEQPDASFDKQLRDSFNAGFVAGQQGFPTCNPAARREAARIAGKGRELSVTLSSFVADDETTR